MPSSEWASATLTRALARPSTAAALKSLLDDYLASYPLQPLGDAFWCRTVVPTAVHFRRSSSPHPNLGIGSPTAASRVVAGRRRPCSFLGASLLWSPSLLYWYSLLYILNSRRLVPIVGHHGFYFFFSLFSPAASLCPPAGLRLPRRAASFARHWLILLRSADFDAAPPLRLRVNEANARERLALSAFVLALVCARPPDVWRLPYWFVYCVR